MQRLVDLWGWILRVKNGTRPNHAELLKQCHGIPRSVSEIPCAVIGDLAVVNVPITSRISERAGYEHAFKVPDIIENHDLSGKSFTIKNLFHGDLRLTTNSRSGIMHCEVVPQSTRHDRPNPPPSRE